MKVFRVPPDWPAPPRRNWEPPKGWQPHPSWPPAPADWEFWIDGEGAPVRGPIGLYGGAERKTVVKTALTVGLTLVAASWIVAVMNTGDGNDAQAITSTTTTSETPTAKATLAKKTPAPKPAKPSATSTPRRTEAKPVRKAARPTPTKTSTPTPTPRPSKTSTATTIKPTPTPTPPPPTVTIRNLEDWQKWCAPGKPYEQYCGAGTWTTTDPGN